MHIFTLCEHGKTRSRPTSVGMNLNFELCLQCVYYEPQHNDTYRGLTWHAVQLLTVSFDILLDIDSSIHTIHTFALQVEKKADSGQA